MRLIDHLQNKLSLLFPILANFILESLMFLRHTKQHCLSSQLTEFTFYDGLKQLLLHEWWWAQIPCMADTEEVVRGTVTPFYWLINIWQEFGATKMDLVHPSLPDLLPPSDHSFPHPHFLPLSLEASPSLCSWGRSFEYTYIWYPTFEQIFDALKAKSSKSAFKLFPSHLEPFVCPCPLKVGWWGKAQLCRCPQGKGSQREFSLLMGLCRVGEKISRSIA